MPNHRTTLNRRESQKERSVRGRVPGKNPLRGLHPRRLPPEQPPPFASKRGQAEGRELRKQR